MLKLYLKVRMSLNIERNLKWCLVIGGYKGNYEIAKRLKIFIKLKDWGDYCAGKTENYKSSLILIKQSL